MSDNIKLLIVDDEIDFLNSIAKRLELRDFDVTTSSVGADAIKIARTEKFDLALLDLKMPGMDGKEVLKILKSEHKFIEVIMLTGHGSMESAIECTKLGAFGYLPKPYEFDKLIDTLKEAYEERIKKKFENNNQKMEEFEKIAKGNSPIAILREMRKLDDGIK
jgi:DNA-binding NtrC family response regulator